MKDFIRRIWLSKLNRALIITGGLAVLFWLLSYITIIAQCAFVLSLAALCFLYSIKIFKKKTINKYEEFFPQSNNLKENLREEREENTQKISKFFFGIIFAILGILIVYRFITSIL